MRGPRDIIDSYCNCCKHTTHHKVLFSKQILRGEDEDYDNATFFYIVECCGCDNVSFVREDIADFWIDKEGDYIPIIETYPFKEGDQEPLGPFSIPHGIYSVYRESVTAFNNNCPLLAAVGFRATIEAICLDKGIKGRDLELMVNNLQKEGHITKQDRDRLHSIRFLGNDSIHQMKEANHNNLKIVLEIVNNIINSLYILDSKTRDLEKPIKNIEEFISLMKEHLNKYNKGEVLSFEQLSPSGRRLIKEDKKFFEQQFESYVRAGYVPEISVLTLNDSPNSTKYVIL